MSSRGTHSNDSIRIESMRTASAFLVVGVTEGSHSHLGVTASHSFFCVIAILVGKMFSS
jgi:hypothetical protein